MFGDHLPDSHDLYVLLYIDMRRRNLVLIIIGAQRVKIRRGLHANRLHYVSHLYVYKVRRQKLRTD